MARSHKDQFTKALKKFPHEKASYDRLAEALGERWTVAKVRERAGEFDGNDSVPIQVVRGGVQYFGCETGAKPGLYKEVYRGIGKRWGRDNSMRNIEVEHTSRTSLKKQGVWTQPDLVAGVDRRADAERRVVFLAIEVEQPGGFSVVSVYQAYEFGRGADFSWVFYTGPKCSGSDWKQITTAAKDLGVGVVHAARPTSPAAWETVIDARARDYTKKHQQAFFARSGLTPNSFGLG